MRRAWVAIAALLLIPTTGCLDGASFDDLWTDLEAKDRFQERALFEDTVEFSPTGVTDSPGVPGGPEDVSDRWNATFDVPDGTRQLTVLFTVNFSTSDAQQPLPANPPDGSIFVYTRGPNPTNESQNLTVEEPIRAGFDFTNPTGGQWTVGYQARGQGTVSWTVLGLVPVEDQSSSG